MQAVHRAFRRAIVRLPNTEAAELRKLDSERLEEMFLSLQAGIRQGDPRSIEVGVKVLTHKAEMNGYKAPARIDMTGTRLDVLVQQQAAAADAQALADLDRLTLEELREYRRLEAKARGLSDVIENETVQAPEAQPPDKPEDAK
jgi:phage FluMu protein gp41